MEQNHISRSSESDTRGGRVKWQVPLAAENESGAVQVPDMLTSLCLLLFNVASLIMWVKNTHFDSTWLGLHVTFLDWCSYSVLSEFCFPCWCCFYFSFLDWMWHTWIQSNQCLYLRPGRQASVARMFLSFCLSFPVGYPFVFFMFESVLLLDNLVSFVCHS